MKEEINDLFVTNVIEVLSLLSKQSSILKEIVEYPGDAEIIARRISALTEEVDAIVMQMTFYGYEKDYSKDSKAMFLYDFFNHFLTHSRNMNYIAKAYVRYNVDEVREEIIEFVSDIEECNKLLTSIFVSFKSSSERKNAIPMVLELRNICARNSNRFDEDMRLLFSSPDDILEVLKMKAVYASLNRVYVTLNDLVALIMKYFMFVR